MADDIILDLLHSEVVQYTQDQNANEKDKDKKVPLTIPNPPVLFRTSNFLG